MAKLDSKRKSHVRTVSDWPRGTRKRSWGFLHDQIWMPKPGHDHRDIPTDRNPDVRLEVINGCWHELYMDRKMLWLGGPTLRLHTFYMGDDDGAPHDHPWWFITFPFRSYLETVQIPRPDHWPPKKPPFILRTQKVRAFLPHFRPAGHRHFVHEPEQKFSTLVVTGRVLNDWSFYPNGKRIRHREWTNYNRSAEE